MNNPLHLHFIVTSYMQRGSWWRNAFQRCLASAWRSLCNIK